MSRCYFLKSECSVDFIGMQETLEMIFDERIVDYYKLEPANGEREAACFYIKGESTRGVQVINKEDGIVIKINSLCNYIDYELARTILIIEGDFLKTQITDEDNAIIAPKEFFTDEKIQELIEDDAVTVLSALKNIVKDNMQIFGVVRNVYFGKGLTQKLAVYENSPAALANAFEKIMCHVQYELPDYKMPGAAMIRPKNSNDEKDFKKIRMMFEGTPYILQDYDYLMLRPDENSDEIILIDNKDLSQIASALFADDSGFEFADDFTAVFPKLEGDEWNSFVCLAREKNHKELLKTVSAAKAEEEDNYQYYGNHWDCVLENTKDDIIPLLSESIEKGAIYGKATCDYTLDEKLHGPVAMLEYDKGDSESAIVVRNVIAADNNKKSNVLVSGFPVVKGGNRIALKISRIQEWENGLEGWITAELGDGRSLTFFDAGYAVNKEKYEIGKSCDFIIGALAYSAKEPESKGFAFEGQAAIDFRAKLGEEPEYDENGNVKPVEFSTEQLCAFLQRGRAPDEAEYISVVQDVKAVKAFGKDFWRFDVIYRSGEGEEIKIPTFVMQSDENKSIQSAKQLQGILWLTGYLA